MNGGPNRLDLGTAGLILFLEGYASLSVEVVALRRIVPYAGSNVPVAAILLAAYLAALALGYERGGRIARATDDLRSQIAKRLAICGALSAFWLSGLGPYVAFSMGASNLVEVTVYSVLGIGPIGWLLAESILLVHKATDQPQASRHAGNIFGLSTAGNVAGGLLTALVVLSTVGTAGAALIVSGTLVAGSLLAGHRRVATAALCTACLLPAVNLWRESTVYVAQTAYADYRRMQLPDQDARVLLVNRQAASRNDPDGTGWEYIEAIEDGLCQSGRGDVLVLGAAGQTLGLGRDCGLNVQFVDIDPEQARMAELLTGEPPRTPMTVSDARRFLLENDREWDAIVADAYSHGMSVPGDLVTVEFFRLLRSRLREGGTLYVNVITRPGDARFRTRVDRTVRSVFADCETRNATAATGTWDRLGTVAANLLYRCGRSPLDGDLRVYSDSVPKATIDRRLQ